MADAEVVLIKIFVSIIGKNICKYDRYKYLFSYYLVVGVARVVRRGEGLVEALLAAAPAGHRAAAGGGAVPAGNI